MRQENSKAMANSRYIETRINLLSYEEDPVWEVILRYWGASWSHIWFKKRRLYAFCSLWSKAANGFPGDSWELRILETWDNLLAFRKMWNTPGIVPMKIKTLTRKAGRKEKERKRGEAKGWSKSRKQKNQSPHTQQGRGMMRSADAGRYAEMMRENSEIMRSFSRQKKFDQGGIKQAKREQLQAQ